MLTIQFTNPNGLRGAHGL